METNLVNITSIPYNYTITVDKDKLLNTIPDSLLANTIELDPTATDIPITNQFVTPKVLRVVEYLVNNERLPTVVSGFEYRLASRYLLIDQLAQLSEPIESSIDKYLGTSFDIRNINQVRKYFNELVQFAVEHHDDFLLWYVLSRIPHNTLTPLEILYEYRQFLQAIGDDYIDLVKLFLDYGVNPSMNYNEPLLNALIRGHLDVAQLLLNDPRVNPNINQDKIIMDFLTLMNLKY